MINESMFEEVNRMAYDDLRKLNEIIRARIKQMALDQNITLAGQFSIGDNVRWTHKNVAHHGKIIRCNLKTATVQETNARQDKWSIEWSLLTKEG